MVWHVQCRHFARKDNPIRTQFRRRLSKYYISKSEFCANFMLVTVFEKSAYTIANPFKFVSQWRKLFDGLSQEYLDKTDQLRS